MEQRPWDFIRGIADETGRVDETEGTSKTEEIVLAEEIIRCFSFIASNKIGVTHQQTNFVFAIRDSLKLLGQPFNTSKNNLIIKVKLPLTNAPQESGINCLARKICSLLW